MMIRTALVASLALMMSVAAQAGEVTVKGSHLCCGACEKGVQAALKDVSGVTDVKTDRQGKKITFKASDITAAAAGLKALAKAGFGGEAEHDGTDLDYPTTGAKEGVKADSVTFSGVHLCCPQCVTAVKKVAEDVNGVKDVEVDREAKTVTLSGKDINVAAAAKALSKHGFHGTVK